MTARTAGGPAQALLIAALIVLFGGLLLKGTSPAARTDGVASVDNGAPRGWLALHLLLARRGHTVVVADGAGGSADGSGVDDGGLLLGTADRPGTLGAGDVVLVPPPERSAYATAEVEQLMRAAERGARVVVVCDPQKARAARLARLTAAAGVACIDVDEATAPTVATAALEGVPAPVFLRDRGRLRLEDRGGLVPLLVAGDGVDDVVAVVRGVGAGDIVVLSSGTTLANDGLGLERSASFLLWLVGDGRRVVIDQRHHRDRARAVLARAALEGPGPLTAAACLLLLVPLALLSLAPRKGDLARARPGAPGHAGDDDDDVPAALSRTRALAALWALAPRAQQAPTHTTHTVQPAPNTTNPTKTTTTKPAGLP